MKAYVADSNQAASNLLKLAASLYHLTAPDLAGIFALALTFAVALALITGHSVPLTSRNPRTQTL